MSNGRDTTQHVCSSIEGDKNSTTKFQNSKPERGRFKSAYVIGRKFNINTTVGPTRDSATFQIMTPMNVRSQAFSTPDSPTRYIPGYFALPSPKRSQPIELNWLLDGSARPNRPLLSASTPRSENRQFRPTRTVSTPATQVSFSLSYDDTDTSNPPLLLVEHANRAEIHRRQKRVESELSEALKGEIEWVRSGGVLRDNNGRRDFARTRRIREQLDVQEQERKALALWAEYEDRWRAGLLINNDRHKNSLSGPTEGEDRDEGIEFRDVVWPVAKPPEDPEGLTACAVQEFVLAPLRVRGVTSSKRRDRIRQLLLRYHPDKTGFLLSRVREEEKDRVREGINNVFMSLKSLQEDQAFRGPK